MTTIELEIKKAQLAKVILNQESEEIINKLLDFYKNLTSKFPCQHTEAEVVQSIDEAIDAFDKGDRARFKTQEEMREKHLR